MSANHLPAGLLPTLPLQIAERIGAGIVEEQFAPGERLKEVELALQFGVSRATVREALRHLEQRGLVSILPQRGARVTELSRKELEDLFEMRAALLGVASRRVAERADEAGLREVRVGLKALEAAVGDASAYARASAAMVETITRVSRNHQIAQFISELGLRFGRYARLGLAGRERRHQSLANWRRLVRAIAAKDGGLAEDIHRSLAFTNLAAGLAEIERRERRRPRSARAAG
jgi:DNA-binding GntR family transcriptional regulator